MLIFFTLKKDVVVLKRRKAISDKHIVAFAGKSSGVESKTDGTSFQKWVGSPVENCNPQG